MDNQCLVCRQSKKEGLHLLHAFICVDCERILVNSSTRDPVYPLLVQKIGHIWKPQKMVAKM
jgi:hypothetical protein